MLRIPACESLCVGSMGRRGGETEESGEGRCLGYRPVSLCVSDLWEEGGERQKSQERGDA